MASLPLLQVDISARATRAVRLFFRASLTKESDRYAGVDLFLLAAARLAAPQNALIHVPSSTAANCSLSPI